MKRRSFFSKLATLIAVITLSPEIIGTPTNRPPIHYDHVIDLEVWIRNELCRRYAEAIDRAILLGR